MAKNLGELGSSRTSIIKWVARWIPDQMTVTDS
jgi:hypothetical protein